MRERMFWNGQYSGDKPIYKGSVGSYRKWKWKVIERFVDVRKKSVLDVGCGDLSFIKGKRFKNYLGLDISPVIIGRNRKKRPDLLFLNEDVTQCQITQQFDVVLCMDLLFHIMTDKGFESLLRNLNNWTREYLFLVNWCKNPLPYVRNDFQHFRDLVPYLDLMQDLELIDTNQRKKDPYNMLYVFRRREEEK